MLMQQQQRISMHAVYCPQPLSKTALENKGVERRTFGTGAGCVSGARLLPARFVPVCARTSMIGRSSVVRKMLCTAVALLLTPCSGVSTDRASTRPSLKAQSALESGSTSRAVVGDSRTPVVMASRGGEYSNAVAQETEAEEVLQALAGRLSRSSTHARHARTSPQGKIKAAKAPPTPVARCHAARTR